MICDTNSKNATVSKKKVDSMKQKSFDTVQLLISSIKSTVLM